MYYLQVSYIIVDEMHHEHPELIRDQYWDDVFPQELPHTKESRPFRGMHPLPSTANIAVPSPALTTVGDGNVFDNSYNKVSNDFHLDSGPFMFSANARKSASLSDAFDPTLAAMSRANSVSNILKRLFSRENSRNDSVSGSMTDVNLLNSNKHLFVSNDENTKKIIDQVIEEVSVIIRYNLKTKLYFRNKGPESCTLSFPPGSVFSLYDPDTVRK